MMHLDEDVEGGGVVASNRLAISLNHTAPHKADYSAGGCVCYVCLFV